MLSFDNESHIYKWNGEIVPSVSAIAGSVSGTDHLAKMKSTKEGRERLKWLANYGTDIHNMIVGINEENDKFPECLEKENFLKWTKKRQFIPNLWEKALYSKKFGFCGTFDMLGTLNGKMAVIDWKSGRSPGPEQYCSCQLNLYSQLIWENRKELGLDDFNPNLITKMNIYNFDGTELLERRVTQSLDSSLYDATRFMERWRRKKQDKLDGWEELKF